MILVQVFGLKGLLAGAGFGDWQVALFRAAIVSYSTTSLPSWPGSRCGHLRLVDDGLSHRCDVLDDHIPLWVVSY